MGKYNVSVGVLRRGQTKPGAPVGAINHEHVTEVYYIVSGSGTLLTGGTVDGVKPLPADGEIVKVAVGPSNQGTFRQAAQTRKVGAWRHRHHPARRVSRVHRRRRSRGLRIGPAGSRSRAAGRLRAPAVEEIDRQRRVAMRARIAASVAFVAALAVGLSGQTGNTSWSVPRTTDGRPDMQGVWANNGMTPLERPKQFGHSRDDDGQGTGRPETARAEADRWRRRVLRRGAVRRGARGQGRSSRRPTRRRATTTRPGCRIARGTTARRSSWTRLTAAFRRSQPALPSAGRHNASRCRAAVPRTARRILGSARAASPTARRTCSPAIRATSR